MAKSHHRCKYVNHHGKVIEFNNNTGYNINTADFYDYKWDPVTKFGRISSIERESLEFNIEGWMLADTKAHGIEMRNEMCEIFDDDVRTFECGRLYVGDYYIDCFITEYQKESYTYTDRRMSFKLKIVTDQKFWISEETHHITKAMGITNTGMDYPFDYPYDYYDDQEELRYIVNNGLPCAFRMTLYGITGTSIHYAKFNGAGLGHMYGIRNKNVSGVDNAYLVIDSIAKTIVLYTEKDGVTESINVFNNRIKNDYVFEPIASGRSMIAFTGCDSMDITLYHERSEPEWT